MLGLSSGYPPVGFHFRVSFLLTLGITDTSFKEVSGISVESSNLEEVHEGGENRLVHKLPVQAKYPNLVLKRGIASITSPLVVWCKTALELNALDQIIPSPLTVSLQDENGLPSMVWMFSSAYPVKWEVGAFDSLKNEVALETIELAYSYVTRMM